MDEHTTKRLLNRFLPYLRYDSCEAFFADSAAEWTDNPSNVLRGPRPPGGTLLEVIAAVEAGAAPDRLSLELLGKYEHQEGDHIGDLRRDYRDQYVELRKNAEYRNRIYGRLALGETGNAWLQYWFFYFYNDYRMAGGLGLHEGDWEMIQLRMPSRDPGPDDVPEEAVYAQHKHAQRCDWSDVEKHPGSDRPVVYVGRGSHASYFEPGVHETEAWIDVADGEATPSELRLELVAETPPGWLRWPGRWGDTEPDRMWRSLGVEQPSPEGPSAHRQWGDPEWLLEGSIQQEPKVYDPKRHHTLSARREGAALFVDCDFSGQVAEPPEKLLVRVNSKQEPDICPRVFTFTLADPPQLTVDTDIELDPKLGYDVHLSTIDARGEPSASVYCFVGPPVAEDPFMQRVMRAVGAWFYRLFGRDKG